MDGIPRACLSQQTSRGHWRWPFSNRVGESRIISKEIESKRRTDGIHDTWREHRFLGTFHGNCPQLWHLRSMGRRLPDEEISPRLWHFTSTDIPVNQSTLPVYLGSNLAEISLGPAWPQASISCSFPKQNTSAELAGLVLGTYVSVFGRSVDEFCSFSVSANQFSFAARLSPTESANSLVS